MRAVVRESNGKFLVQLSDRVNAIHLKPAMSYRNFRSNQKLLPSFFELRTKTFLFLLVPVVVMTARAQTHTTISGDWPDGTYW
jgi:hypothetical protein